MSIPITFNPIGSTTGDNLPPGWSLVHSVTIKPKIGVTEATDLYIFRFSATTEPRLKNVIWTKDCSLEYTFENMKYIGGKDRHILMELYFTKDSGSMAGGGTYFMQHANGNGFNRVSGPGTSYRDSWITVPLATMTNSIYNNIARSWRYSPEGYRNVTLPANSTLADPSVRTVSLSHGTMTQYDFCGAHLDIGVQQIHILPVRHRSGREGVYETLTNTVHPLLI